MSKLVGDASAVLQNNNAHKTDTMIHVYQGVMFNPPKNVTFQSDGKQYIVLYDKATTRVLCFVYIAKHVIKSFLELILVGYQILNATC